MRVIVISLLVLLLAVSGRATRVAADEGCDANEQIACIPLPPQGPVPQPGPTGASSNAAGAPAAVAVPVPAPGGFCPSPYCCPPLLGPSPAVPQTPSVPVPSYGCCSGYPPPLSGAAGVAAVPQSPAVPVPPQYYCPSYRGIYTTINLGNAADARALRTLSSQDLSPYWRGSALAQLRSQIADLRARGVYASVRLYSIQVQDASFIGGGTATVHTMEHWLYQERWRDDGTTVFSQDEWVANEYNLTFTGGAWYITDNTATLVGGPVPYPLAGG